MNKKLRKKILLSSVSVVLVGAMGAGIWFGVTHSKKDPITVIPFSEIGMTEYWGDNMESHGPVSSDNIQTVFLSDTQKVTEVLVKEGDTVKKGDPIMTFDTTLSALDLERKRLEVEKLKLELQDEEATLQKIKNMRPMQEMPEMPEFEPAAPDLGEELTNAYKVTGKPGFDGSKQEAPLICWLKDGTEVDQRLVDTILDLSLGLQMDGGISQLSSPSGDKDGEQPQKTEPQTGESQPAELQSGETQPVTPQSAETKPAETKPAETKPAETKPTETKPAESQPKETDPAPEPFQVVQPASRENWRVGTVLSHTLVLREKPAADGRVMQEINTNNSTNVKVFDEVTAEDTVWLFVALGPNEGWTAKADIKIEEQTVPPADPPVPVDPGIPEEEEIPKIKVDFYCNPENAVVSLRRNGDNTWISADPGTRNIFTVEPGRYYFSVDHEGYKSQTEKKLLVREDASTVHVSVELEPYQDLSKLNSAYVVFKATEDNMSRGFRTLWQGVKLYQDGSFRFFDASMIPDYTMVVTPQAEMEMPEFDFGSGMTAAQISQMRQDQEKKIEDVKLKAKMAEADYKIKKRELEDGNIYADFDGKVVSLLDEQEARKRRKPMIKVSGGGGYQVEGSVNELDRENLKIGQEVTVNDWNSGETYTGKVISVGDFPVRSRGYSGRGNPDSSYYPFTVFVDGEANLQTGSYVNIQYSTAGENGLYLSNPFIREEKGQSYVFVMDESGRLRKQTVTTGKSLWGSYTEIISGLSQEDLLAFPYGKNVKAGARAEQGTMGDLY